MSVEVLRFLNFNWQTYIDEFTDILENTLFKILKYWAAYHHDFWNSTQQM